jgi:RNA polymerase sigma-70 factor (ECF subfamily)
MRFLRSKKKPDIPDSELLETYRHSPQSEIIEILFERYCHLAFAVCMKYLKNEEDSKDAVMHLFAHMPEDLQKYKVDHFSHWLYIITKNYCLKELRSRKNFSTLEEAGLPNAVGAHPGDEEDFDLTPRHLQQLDQALAALSKEQMECVKLFYLDERTYKEIAGQTGYSLKQVKSFIQNGKRNLRNYLERKNGNG